MSRRDFIALIGGAAVAQPRLLLKLGRNDLYGSWLCENEI